MEKGGLSNEEINTGLELSKTAFTAASTASLAYLVYASADPNKIVKEIKQMKHSDLSDNTIEHHGILGMKWGVRRYQNPDGTLTNRGKARMEKKDTKWAATKGEKIKEKTLNKTTKDMRKFINNELEVNYTSSGKLSSDTILQYNNHLADLMNERVSEVRTPSGRVLKFVAKRGEIGVHTAVADAGYDMQQLKRGVFKTGKVAYKQENLMKGGDR